MNLPPVFLFIFHGINISNNLTAEDFASAFWLHEFHRAAQQIATILRKPGYLVAPDHTLCLMDAFAVQPNRKRLVVPFEKDTANYSKPMVRIFTLCHGNFSAYSADPAIPV
jgi:hypothetical protein